MSVCVIVRQEDYSIRYGEVWFVFECLLSLHEYVQVFPHVIYQAVVEYVRTEMMLNMTRERAKLLRRRRAGSYKI